MNKHPDKNTIEVDRADLVRSLRIFRLAVAYWVMVVCLAVSALCGVNLVGLGLSLLGVSFVALMGYFEIRFTGPKSKPDDEFWGNL